MKWTQKLIYQIMLSDQGKQIGSDQDNLFHHKRVNAREPEWTDAIAVGSGTFVDNERNEWPLRTERAWGYL